MSAVGTNGRAVTYLLLPFSFREYLKALGVEFRVDVIEYSDRLRGELLHYLRNYVLRGGFPELVLRPDLHNEILYSITEGIFYRDIVERYGVRRVELLRYLMRLVARCVGKEFTVTKLHNVLKGSGLRTSKSTVLEYLRMLNEALLFFYVKQLNTPLQEAIKKPRKVYIVDNSLLKPLGGTQEMGPLLENTVFLELLRYKNLNPFIEINYWKAKPGGPEVDFIVRKGPEVTALIQVTHTLSEDNRRREVNALLKASKLLNCKNLQILTWDQEEVIKINNQEIRVTPLWKWLIKEELRHSITT